jgi:hypothetical protein
MRSSFNFAPVLSAARLAAQARLVEEKLVIAKITLKAGLAVSLVLCSIGLASAQVRGRTHGYAYRPAPAAGEASPDPRAFQAYGGSYGTYHGYNHVPFDPLVPLKPEVPPPVDPNEPASGSYGAMLQGRNPAAGT